MATLFSVSYFNLYVFALVLAPQNQTPSTRLSRSHPLYRHRRRCSDINSTSFLASPHGLVAPEKSNVGKKAYALKTLNYLRTLFCINICFKLSRCQLCKSHQPALPGRTRGWFGFRFSYGIVNWDSVLACHARPRCSIHWPFILVTQPHYVSGPGPNRKTGKRCTLRSASVLNWQRQLIPSVLLTQLLRTRRLLGRVSGYVHHN